MDRQTRRLAGFGLMFLLAASGCRSTRSEVPPGRRYSGDGRQIPSVGFSSDPHPAVGGAAMAPGAPGSGAPAQFGLPQSATPNYGAPTSNAFGPPDTATALPGATAPSAAPGGLPLGDPSPSPAPLPAPAGQPN